MLSFCFICTKKNFISLYALVLSLSISLVALHSLRSLSLKKEITLALYFQKQSMLYAKNVKEIAVSCLTKLNFHACEHDQIAFDSYFYAEYYLSPLTSTTQGQRDILLDISIHSPTLLSTHALRFGKRYVLKGFP